MTDNRLKKHVPFPVGSSSSVRTGSTYDSQSNSLSNKRSFFDISPRKLGEKTTEERFVLPPLPEEDDDLLSHYASPKPSWDPLPFDIFPRPNAELERAQSASFPCFHYFDLNKYALKEARQLSAMDIIPKEALKKNSEQHSQRTKRSKRITAESAHVKGYYRRKNEGVEMVYSHMDNHNKMGLRTRKAATSLSYGNDDYGTKENYDRRRKSSTPRTPSPPPGPMSVPLSKATPKKQGNRLQFLANLRRDFALGIKQTPREINGTTESQQQNERQSSFYKKQMEKAEKAEKKKRRQAKREAKLRAMAANVEYAAASGSVSTEPASDAALHSIIPPRVAGKRGKKKQFSAQAAALDAFVNGKDDGKEINIATALTANEELGASDDERF